MLRMRRIRNSFMLEFKLGRASTCVLLYFIFVKRHGRLSVGINKSVFAP